MVKWLGSWYFREGKTGMTSPSWRNRNDDRIVNAPKTGITQSDLDRRKPSGYEPTGANFYGNIPESKRQANKDLIRVKRKR